MGRTGYGNLAEHAIGDSWKSGIHALRVRDRELGRLEGTTNIRSGSTGISASFKRSVDYVFDIARFGFSRTEHRSIKLNIWDGTYRYPIYNTGAYAGTTPLVVEGKEYYVVPSGQYIRLEVSGHAASGSCKYGVYTERL